MKFSYQLLVVVLTSLSCVSTAQAADYFMSQQTQGNNGYSSQYNPWRPQPQRWGYQQRQYYSNQSGNGRLTSYTPQPRQYAAPISQIQARQFEYRRYVQQVNPYYGTNNGLPWWADQNAVPFGPAAIGNGWPNGLW